MANTTSYGMGQLRYSNNSTYMSSCNFKWEPVNVNISSENGGSVYQDVVLYSSNGTNFSFKKGTAYLLKISIPKDLNYNITYQIKLIEVSPSNQTPNPLKPDIITYQMLKYINVPKDTSTGSASRVIIYPTHDGQIGVGDDGSYETQVAIALDQDSTTGEPGQIYYDESNNKYYIYVSQEGGDIISQEIESKNDIILNHTWSSQHSKSKVDFSFIFTPRDPDVTYSQIWIEILRESYDQNIRSDGIYGRKIDLDSGLFQADVYELKNLLGDSNGISDVTALNHIGVYSHPNTIMAINGEEIRVGQSGYYELNDFEITSLGIVTDDNSSDNKFVIDYQYQAATS